MLYLSVIGQIKTLQIVAIFEEELWSEHQVLRLKSHGFRYLAVFEIAHLFVKTNRFGTSQTTNMK
jgi:hypothetical protein